MKRAEVLKILFVLFLNLVSINATAANRKIEIVPEKLHPFNKTALKYRGDFPWDTYCEDFNVEDGTVSVKFRDDFKIIARIKFLARLQCVLLLNLKGLYLIKILTDLKEIL